MIIIVAYDIADNRRRTRLHTLLLGYGNAVQKSVIECDVNEVQWRAMQTRVRQIIDDRVDRIAYYVLCQSCAAKAVTVSADGHDQKRLGPPSVVVV